MKSLRIFSVFCLSLLVGCQYEDPLVAENTLPIDSAILGVWAPIVEPDKKVDESERMVIMKFSDTEYAVNYPTGNGLYYRAYPIKVGDVSCVQLQVLRWDNDGDKKDEKLFHVASYQLTGDELEVKTLNKAVMPSSIRGTEALKKAFIAKQGAEDLFAGAEKFRRVKDE